ncbi:MAG: hypothetical protein ACRBBW_14670 [Cellvibrionaceae bacterium]
MNIKNFVFLAVISLVMTGCISPKSYVDPSFSKATYDDVKPVNNKYITEIVVEFQRNGKLYERVNPEVRSHVERTLRATGIITPAAENTDISVKVTVNNVADITEAAAKGFGTGLTFGAAGSLVTDYYEITIEYDDGKGGQLIENYKHALHTTIGNADAPFDNTLPTTPADAFGTVVEQTLLNFVKDMQAKGLLSIKLMQEFVHSV